MILVRYGEDRPENKHYVSIARFLTSVGVRVPAIYFHDELDGLILMEDAGETDLWSQRQAPWLSRRALYQRTLDQAVLLHTSAHRSPHVPDLSLQPVFDATLYRWEQEYFIEHCFGRHFGMDEASIAQVCDRGRLQAIADELAAEPRCLVHRDFQSQNVIVHDGEVCLIDFQGLRPGLAQYDIASLLYDPYVDLTAAEREDLLDHYLAGVFGPGHTDDPRWREIYRLCAMQRLMQALGAYGKLGHTDGRTEFLAHVPAALSRLCEIANTIEGLAPLASHLKDLSR